MLQQGYPLGRWRMLNIALIIYCTIVYGIHGGEGVKGVERQLRNLFCALPFGLVCANLFGPELGLLYFALAYGGTSLGFNEPRPAGSLWMAGKGFITCPFGGFITLPLAYWLGNKTRWKSVASEYLSGTGYGIILCILIHLEHFMR